MNSHLKHKNQDLDQVILAAWVGVNEPLKSTISIKKSTPEQNNNKTFGNKELFHDNCTAILLHFSEMRNK